MKSDVKQKWVEALRSGKYTKGEEYFKRIDENGQCFHCAVGVLFDLIKDDFELKEVSDKREDIEVFSFVNKSYKKGSYNFKLSMMGVLNEIDLCLTEYLQIVDMNDGVETINARPRSFNEIADWIEANF